MKYVALTALVAIIVVAAITYHVGLWSAPQVGTEVATTDKPEAERSSNTDVVPVAGDRHRSPAVGSNEGVRPADPQEMQSEPPEPAIPSETAPAATDSTVESRQLETDNTVPSPQGSVSNDFERIGELIGHTEQIRTVSLSPDGKVAISGGADQVIRIWDVAQRTELNYLRGHTGTVHRVAFTPDGETVISCSYDGTLRVWDIEKGWERHRFELGGDVRDFALAPNGHQIAAAVRHAERNSIQLCYIGTWITGRNFQSRSPVWTVDFSPDGNWIASGANDGRVEIREQHTQELRVLGRHSSLVSCVRFSHDGSFLLSYGRDGMVYEWDLATREKVNEIEAASDWGSQVTLVDGDAFCLSTGNEVRLWRMPTAEVVDSFGEGGGAVTLNLEAGLLALAVGERIELWRLPEYLAAVASTQTGESEARNAE